MGGACQRGMQGERGASPPLTPSSSQTTLWITMGSQAAALSCYPAASLQEPTKLDDRIGIPSITTSWSQCGRGLTRPRGPNPIMGRDLILASLFPVPLFAAVAKHSA
ncbi:hypothetical protein ACRALDRAFT_1077122 [Sodiomyces alcalophilus JCM 7366]|uniref:uncharacterized protein n=1 Tax=Sodiomyces alcalophilus JCM 7366 TaxID=591952 RepID=UPI0039B43B11